MAAGSREPRYLLSREDIETLLEAHISHPWNPESDVYMQRLSPHAGLSRIALTIAKVPPCAPPMS